jgi:ribosomal protein L37AE/L43A
MLSDNNWYPSCQKKKEYLCKECKAKTLKDLEKNYRHQLERDEYSIKKDKRVFAPRIKVKKEDKDSIFKMLDDTEKYRIARLLKILNGKDTKPDVKEKIIVYLLRSHTLLNAKMVAMVINKANVMFASKDVGHETIVRLANALKTCSLDNRMFKKGSKEEVYEQMRTSKKTIEIDIPDL